MGVEEVVVVAEEIVKVVQFMNDMYHLSNIQGHSPILRRALQELQQISGLKECVYAGRVAVEDLKVIKQAIANEISWLHNKVEFETGKNKASLTSLLSLMKKVIAKGEQVKPVSEVQAAEPVCESDLLNKIERQLSKVADRAEDNQKAKALRALVSSVKRLNNEKEDLPLYLLLMQYVQFVVTNGATELPYGRVRSDYPVIDAKNKAEAIRAVIQEIRNLDGCVQQSQSFGLNCCIASQIFMYTLGWAGVMVAMAVLSNPVALVALGAFVLGSLLATMLPNFNLDRYLTFSHAVYKVMEFSWAPKIVEDTKTCASKETTIFAQNIQTPAKEVVVVTAAACA